MQFWAVTCRMFFLFCAVAYPKNTPYGVLDFSIIAVIIKKSNTRGTTEVGFLLQIDDIHREIIQGEKGGMVKGEVILISFPRSPEQRENIS